MKLYTEMCEFGEENRKQFNLDCNVVSHSFDRCLNLQIKGLVKIRIDLTSKNDIMRISGPVEGISVAIIVKSFDFNLYDSLSKYERRKLLLETLYEAIQLMCKELKYNLAPFTATYEKVKELNYENKFVFNKLAPSPNRKYKAGIQIEVNETVADISTVYFDSKTMQPIKQVKIMNTIPHYMYIYEFMGKGAWTDNETYTVTSRRNQVQFVTSLRSDVVDMKFFPQTETLEELQTAFKKVQPFEDL